MSTRSAELLEMAARIEGLERRHRRFFRGVIAAVLILGSGGLLKAQLERFGDGVQPDAPEVTGTLPREIVEERVISREFVLVDRAGNRRASLVADNAGSVFLTLLDTESNLRAALSVMNRGPALTFYDQDGQVRAVLGSTTLVGSHVEDAAGNLERATPSSIVLFDDQGNLLWREP